MVKIKILKLNSYQFSRENLEYGRFKYLSFMENQPKRVHLDLKENNVYCFDNDLDKTVMSVFMDIGESEAIKKKREVLPLFSNLLPYQVLNFLLEENQFVVGRFRNFSEGYSHYYYLDYRSFRFNHILIVYDIEDNTYDNCNNAIIYDDTLHLGKLVKESLLNKAS